MASDQKYKEGDGPYLQWEANNRDELMVFTDKQQCYKTRLSGFDDTKASALGDYLPSKLGMDPEERAVWACVPGDQCPPDRRSRRRGRPPPGCA